MSTYIIVEYIQNARTPEAVEVCEKWINQMNNRFSNDLADLALIKKCELIGERYPVEE